MVAYSTSAATTTPKRISQKNVCEATVTFLQQNYHLPIDFKQEAAKFQMSYSAFRKLIKNNFGKAPQQLVNEIRLQKKAHKMVRFSHLSISEIAEKTGFNSVYYFSRAYKKYYGKSPQFFRKSM